MTSPDRLRQVHQLVAQSRLAYQTVERRREQTRQLVSASQQCCAQSLRAVTGPRRQPLAARPRISAQPGEQSWVAPGAPLPSSAPRARAAP